MGKGGSFTDHMMNFPMSFNQFTYFTYIKGVCESVVCPSLARGRVEPQDKRLHIMGPQPS